MELHIVSQELLTLTLNVPDVQSLILQQLAEFEFIQRQVDRLITLMAAQKTDSPDLVTKLNSITKLAVADRILTHPDVITAMKAFQGFRLDNFITHVCIQSLDARNEEIDFSQLLRKLTSVLGAEEVSNQLTRAGNIRKALHALSLDRRGRISVIRTILEIVKQGGDVKAYIKDKDYNGISPDEYAWDNNDLALCDLFNEYLL